MGAYLSDVFEKVYVLMKLSFMFWLSTLMGGIILGVGPALLTITTVFNQIGWDSKGIKLMDTWTLFKEHFKRGNGLFFMMLGLVLVGAYNLYLSTQITGLFILLVQFIIVVVLVLVILSYVNALVIGANFEIAGKHLLKLSVISVFANFFTIIKMLVSIAVLSYVTFKFPGLIIFISAGLFAVLIVTNNRQLIAYINAQF